MSKKKNAATVLATFAMVIFASVGNADTRAFYNNTVDWETRSLVDHEFLKDQNIELGHTIDRHYARSHGYLGGRCLIGQVEVGNTTLTQVRSSYGNDGWQVANNARDALFAHRGGISIFVRNMNEWVGAASPGYYRLKYVKDHRLLDSGGEKYVRCKSFQSGAVLPTRSGARQRIVVGMMNPSYKHNSVQIPWFLVSSFPVPKDTATVTYR